MAANVRDRFDSGGIVAIRERPESRVSPVSARPGEGRYLNR